EWLAAEQLVELVPQSTRGELDGRQLERLKVDHGVILKALALVAEHRLRIHNRPEREAHTEGIAALEQPLDVDHALALGLGEVVAFERLEHCPSRSEVELEHLVGAAEMEIDRAFVHGRIRARGLNR